MYYRLLLSLFFIATEYLILDAAVLINVKPTQFDVGISKSLTIECLVSRIENPSMSYLISLTLYHSNDPTRFEFQYIASLNSFEANVSVHDGNDSNVQYVGAINNKNDSFLRVTWSYPHRKVAGVYKCEANGFNKIGRSLILTSTSEVTATDPNTDVLAREIQRLSTAVEYLQTRCNTTENRLNSLLHLRQLRLSHQNAAANAFFFITPALRNSRYMLTKKSYKITPDEAEKICEILGGYLAEIDSKEEFEFIRDNLFTKGQFFVFITGATDEIKEGIWINRYSQSKIKFVNWGPGEPNGGRLENIQCYIRYSDNKWHMNDCPQSVFETYNAAFICEVEALQSL